MNAGQLFL